MHQEVLTAWSIALALKEEEPSKLLFFWLTGVEHLEDDADCKEMY